MVDLAAAVAAAVQGDTAGTTEVRYGTVAAGTITAQTMPVEIAGSVLVSASYLVGYTPRVGDRVLLLRQGADWTVLAGKAGFAGNRVLNSRFEEAEVLSATISLPLHWTGIMIDGSPSNSPAGVLSAIETGSPSKTGLRIMRADGTQGPVDIFALSASIPVVPGQVWRVAAGASVGGNANPVTTTLVATWFGSPEAQYPSTVAANTSIDSITTGVGQFVVLSGTAVVPVNALFMRVGFRNVQPTAAGGLINTFTMIDAYLEL